MQQQYLLTSVQCAQQTQDYRNTVSICYGTFVNKREADR